MDESADVLDKEHMAMVSLLVNVARASCKRKDKIRDSQREIIEEGISSGEIKTGKGLNQESSLQKPGATRWGFILRISAVWSAFLLLG